MEKTIVLVGLMGAGKSTVGRRLAKLLQVDFKDSDDEITDAAGCSISDLFSVHGESIFRDLEERVICRLLTDESPKVLATGGGAWMNARVRELSKEHAHSIWLRAEVDVLLDRVSRKSNRPLLEKGDKKTILQKMVEERYPFYALADMIIDSDAGTHDDIAHMIINALALSIPRPASSTD